MNELRQQKYKQIVTVEKERLIINSIYEKLIEKKFINAQLNLQILINTMLWDKKKV